jgi:hypothetical protein
MPQGKSTPIRPLGYAHIAYWHAHSHCSGLYRSSFSSLQNFKMKFSTCCTSLSLRSASSKLSIYSLSWHRAHGQDYGQDDQLESQDPDHTDREAGLELELELHQGRDLIQHIQYNPAFILLGIKYLVASLHHSSILFPLAHSHPLTSPFRSFYSADFGPSSPQS